MRQQQFDCYNLGLITYDQIGNLEACNCQLQPEEQTEIININQNVKPLGNFKLQKQKVQHSKWSQLQDSKLIQLVQKYGTSDWNRISVHLHFSSQQCQQRYNRVLKPGIKKGKWTESEDEQLIILAKDDENINWSFVAKQLGNRTDVQCRYRYMKIHNISIPQDQIPNKQ